LPAKLRLWFESVPTPPRLPSRLELLDPQTYQPQLAPSPELAVPPVESATPERAAATRTWQALQARPEDVVRDREELDKLDRAIVAARRQTLTARAEAASAKARAAQLEQSRFGAPLVWGLGALAGLAGLGWLHQRRQLLALRARQEDEPVHFYPMLASPAAFPPAVEPTGDSEFEPTEIDVHADEADQWIARAGLAMPSGR
jgi:hypothetical protein